MTEAAQIVQFPKKDKKKKKTTISLEVQTEVLEDGGIWMRTRLNTDKEWGEWERAQ